LALGHETLGLVDEHTAAIVAQCGLVHVPLSYGDDAART
jgi:hypothetical protein